MLIYNYHKEFLGIDEGDLKTLGFSNLLQLRSESADFADLFVKTPGFVHNFKHVHWIDFVTCAEGSEDSKVIIRANGKNFKATLDIKTAYLVDNPTEEAYLVNLVNVRALTHNENEQVAGDVFEKPAARTSTENTAIFNTPKPMDTVQKEPEEKVEIEHDPYEQSTTDTLDILESKPDIVEDIYEDTPIDLGDDLLEIDNDLLDLGDDLLVSEAEGSFVESHEPEIEAEPVHEEQPAVKPTVKPESKLDTIPAPTLILNAGADYVYDPHLASDELGLPVDLIEEFIQDFISQAAEFKDELYVSVHDGNLDNIKILSHKLKGVAANLRIEDAFEVLTTINTSEDSDEIIVNMDMFYRIIDKLAGKTAEESVATGPAVSAPETEEITNNSEDDIVLDFKDDFSQEPKIEMDIADDLEIPEEIIGLEEPAEELLDFKEEPEIEINIADDLEIPEEIIGLEEPAEEPAEELLDFKEDEPEIEINIADDLEIPEQTHQEIPQVLYNKDVAASEIGLDAQSFEELFEDYVAEGNTKCNKINTAIQENNSDLWKSTAVKLKGMSDNMRIHDFTSELESIINTEDSSVAKEAIDTISAKLEQISNAEV